VPTLAFVLLLQAAGATPVPTPTPKVLPAPRKTPVVASGAGATRTLSDVARELRLRKGSGETPPKPASLTMAPAGGGIGGKGHPAASVSPSATPAAGSVPAVVVESAEHESSVGTGGLVRVFGTVRNAGDTPACGVALSVRLYDSRDAFLVSGSGTPDEPVLKPGGRSSYSVTLHVPPGVAGALPDKDLTAGMTQGSVTLEGTWRTLGRAETEVVAASDSCAGGTPAPAAAEPEPPPETPTATPR
jgi:hypothetical protein